MMPPMPSMTGHRDARRRRGGSGRRARRSRSPCLPGPRRCRARAARAADRARPRRCAPASASRPRASSRRPVSDVCGARGSKPVITGLSASTRPPARPQCAIRPRGDEGLADVGAGCGNEDGGHAASRDPCAHQVGERADVAVVVARGEGEAQARGARRHRRRADRHHQEALGFEQARRGQRRLGGADDQRHDRALRRGEVGARW